MYRRDIGCCPFLDGPIKISDQTDAGGGIDLAVPRCALRALCYLERAKLAEE